MSGDFVVFECWCPDWNEHEEDPIAVGVNIFAGENIPKKVAEAYAERTWSKHDPYEGITVFVKDRRISETWKVEIAVEQRPVFIGTVLYHFDGGPIL